MYVYIPIRKPRGSGCSASKVWKISINHFEQQQHSSGSSQLPCLVYTEKACWSGVRRRHNSLG